MEKIKTLNDITKKPKIEKTSEGAFVESHAVPVNMTEKGDTQETYEFWPRVVITYTDQNDKTKYFDLRQFGSAKEADIDQIIAAMKYAKSEAKRMRKEYAEIQEAKATAKTAADAAALKDIADVAAQQKADSAASAASPAAAAPGASA